LRHALIRAISSLKPEDDVPPQSPAQRAYQVLFFRYVQQCSQEEVADQLGLGVRQLRREQRRALEVLAQRLREQHGLEITTGGNRQPSESLADGSEGTTLAGMDLQWLEEAAATEPVQLDAVLPAVMELLQPIAANYHVRLRLPEAQQLPVLAVDTVALRQILLSLLCVAVRRTAGGRLSMAARPSGWHVGVRVEGVALQPRPEPTPEDALNLATARQLTEACGGSLTVTDEPGRFAADILLPAVEQIPVLVVDDNADTLRLLQRYAACTRYRVYGAQDWGQALSLAQEVSPQIIVLDIMMPRVDGWELFRRLAQHPATRDAPVIACTILAQEELAASLGIQGFLRKPVSRRDFLIALDRLAPDPAT
jgi:CheY-like chemotaxis protein